MQLVSQRAPSICLCCIRSFTTKSNSLQFKNALKYSTNRSPLPQVTNETEAEHQNIDAAGDETHKTQPVTRAKEDGDPASGAMSQRLSDMTEDSLASNGRGIQKALDEGGFSEELKQKLEARIQDNSFRSDNPAAFAQINIPASAGKGTRDIATAEAWTGTESLSDSALRMLNDAHKPLRNSGPPKIPQPSISVDMRMKNAVKKSRADRLANARDRTSVYALSQDPTLSEKEKENMRKILKERFTPGARPMPGSVQGLAALANERIEDAISRGQFKNIARGKGKNVERDYNANSPFLDTTEYFMNKIIQKQEIVPPWIEKQQELVKAAAVFRGRLRSDWKRHAARVIASKGGSLEAQVRRAEAYAQAEEAAYPKRTKTESMTEIDSEGKLSQLTVKETPTPNETSESKIVVSEDTAFESSPPPPSTELASTEPEGLTSISTHIDRSEPPNKGLDPSTSPQPPSPLPTTPPPPSSPPLPPFRDPSYLSLEHAYHTLSITTLNNLTRSYNLLAPDLAKKPYFNLDRELRSCFADIAPMLPNEIRERARKPEKVRVEVVGHRAGGVLERFGMERGRVFDDRREKYGWREFWRDVWGGGGGGGGEGVKV